MSLGSPRTGVQWRGRWQCVMCQQQGKVLFVMPWPIVLMGTIGIATIGIGTTGIATIWMGTIWAGTNFICEAT